MTNIIRAFIEFHTGTGDVRTKYGCWHKIASETDEFYVTTCGLILFKTLGRTEIIKLELPIDESISNRFCDTCKEV